MKKILLTGLILFCTQANYAQNTWMRKADFGGTARSGAVGFGIGSKGYTGMGIGDGTNGNAFWEYDPATNTWAQKADFRGNARWAAVGFSIGKKGYIGTGWDNKKYEFYKDFWEYDPATNTWTRKADFGGAERYEAVGFSIGSKGYIGTGSNSKKSNIHYNDFWEYDPAANAWTRKADFGGGYRKGAAGFSIGNKGYIGTGDDAQEPLLDFWEYDPATNKWTRKASFGGTPRSLAVGFSNGSKGYIGTGGFSYAQVRYNDFWEYDPATNAWTKKADVGGSGRRLAVGFSIGSKGYIGTGDDINGYYLKDFWEYTPKNNNTCANATSTSVTNITSTSATLNWVASVNPALWQIQYRRAGSTVWTNSKPAGSVLSLNISSLTPNRKYNWHIRAKCGTTWTAYSGLESFTTLAALQVNGSQSASIKEAGIEKSLPLRLYPNPTHGQFVIDLLMAEKTNTSAKIELFNMMGQTVSIENGSITAGRLQKTVSMPSSLLKGTYFVKVMVNDKAYVAKLIYEK